MCFCKNFILDKLICLKIKPPTLYFVQKKKKKNPLIQVFNVTNLVFLLLLFAYVPQVGIVFNNVLAHLIHSVHQQLQTLP